MKWMQLTRWSVQSCTIVIMFFFFKLCILTLNLFAFSVDPCWTNPWTPLRAHTGKDDAITYSTVPVHRASIHLENCGSHVSCLLKAMLSAWLNSGSYHTWNIFYFCGRHWWVQNGVQQFFTKNTCSSFFIYIMNIFGPYSVVFDKWLPIVFLHPNEDRS